MIGTIAGILVLGLGWTGLVVIGAWLTWRGANGRRVDRTPYCRRCGYMLLTRPRRPVRCSECGAALAAPGGVRLGRRRRSVPAALAGSSMLAVAASMTWYMLQPPVQAAPIVRKLALPAGAAAPGRQTPVAPVAPHPRRVERSPDQLPGMWAISDLYMPAPPPSSAPPDVEADADAGKPRGPRRATSPRPSPTTPPADRSWSLLETWNRGAAAGSAWQAPPAFEGPAIELPTLESLFASPGNLGGRAPRILDRPPGARQDLEAASIEPLDSRLDGEPLPADRVDRRIRPVYQGARSRSRE